ncbi:MAG: hypothetical protein LBN01_01855 [Endomicrobium sp.]|jgi:predicted nucleic acid-binding protein|nr:hypothetical protein [Endomicrobium sp.]
MNPVTYNKDYLAPINKAYETNFENMDKYKQEDNFKKKVLSKISLEDVFHAVEFAKEIRKHNRETSKESKESNDFEYYLDNPDLTIHECVEEMLEDAGVISNCSYIKT